MEIIRLPVEEWQQYRDLRLRALKEDPQAFSTTYADAVGFPDEMWRGRLLDALQGGHSWLFFAREAGKLVGMIGAFVDEASPQTATIVSVYVPAEERGKGISAAMMACILSELSTNGALKKAVLAVNKAQLPAMGLYEKFGFQIVGMEPGVSGEGKPVEELLMERPLPF